MKTTFISRTSYTSVQSKLLPFHIKCLSVMTHQAALGQWALTHHIQTLVNCPLESHLNTLGKHYFLVLWKQKQKQFLLSKSNKLIEMKSTNLLIRTSPDLLPVKGLFFSNTTTLSSNFFVAFLKVGRNGCIVASGVATASMLKH